METSEVNFSFGQYSLKSVQIIVPFQTRFFDTSTLTAFLEELHLVLTLTGATEALIFKVEVVSRPFLITVLRNRFKNTRKIQSEIICTSYPRHANSSQEGLENLFDLSPRKKKSYLFVTVKHIITARSKASLKSPFRGELF